MKKLFAALGFLLALIAGGEAKAVCTLPYVLQNGVIPDATQVMANFYALQACINTATSACSTNFPGLVPATGGVAGTFLRSDCTFAAPPGSTGTVTSVGLSVPTPSIFGVTGSPVTTTGTLGVTIAGTFGGIPYFNSVSTLASSGQLGFDQLVVGGGPVAAPATPVGLGTATTVLHGNAGGPPNWGSVANADLSNSSTTVNGVICTLGSSCAVPTLPGVRAQVFTSNGTHTIVANNEKVTICAAGGGAGGSLIDLGSPGGGGGGGGGAVATTWLTGLTVGATLTVVVGGPGSGGTFGQTGGTAPTNGSNGTDSSVSSGSQGISTLTAGAGLGGPHGVPLTDVSGGAGGSAGGPVSINSPGQSGDSGLSGGAPGSSGFAQSIPFVAGGMSGCPFGTYGIGGRSTGAGSSAAGSGESGHPGIVVFEAG